MCGDKILFNKLLQKEWRSGISRRCQKFLSQIFNLHLRSIVPKCMKWMHGGTRSNAIPSLIVDSQPKIHKQGRNIYWNETKNLIPVTNDDNHDYITVETPQGFDTKVVDYHILNKSERPTKFCIADVLSLFYLNILLPCRILGLVRDLIRFNLLLSAAAVLLHIQRISNPIMITFYQPISINFINRLLQTNYSENFVVVKTCSTNLYKRSPL